MNKPRKIVVITIEGETARQKISFSGRIDFNTAAEVVVLLATRGYKKAPVGA